MNPQQDRCSTVWRADDSPSAQRFPRLLSRAALVFAVGIAALQLPRVACAQPQTLVIAIQPTSTPEQLSAQATELEQFLEAQLPGIDVRLKFPTSYAGAIESLRFGHAQAAFMSAWPAVLAHQHAGADVVLAEVREVTVDETTTEAPSYYSYWIVRKDSLVANLRGLQGRKAAFPSQLSTSGYVAPLARLVELGLVNRQDGPADPKQFFGEVVFAGGYAQAWEALKAGQVDVTVIAGDVPEALYRKVLANTRVLEQQGPIPSHAVVFSKDLQDPLRMQLVNALLQLNDPAHRGLMRKFVSGIFVRFAPATTEQHLGTLHRLLDLTGLEYTETSR